MRKIVLSLMGLLCVALSTSAQNKTITGHVIDDKGKAVQGVSITATSKNGAQTDVNGNYSISVIPAAKQLTFSSINFETQSVAINGRAVIDVVLTPTQKQLEEVLVVGYGTKTVRENTSSISKVKGEKLAEVPLPTFDQALAGKTAGVQINATGGILGDGVAIRVRGINSITSSSQPLIVVDGIPQRELTNTNGFNGGDGTRFNPLALLNPNDIESVEILKDAGAGAIYGSRASNGVILVTTKKGKKGTAKITVDAKYGFSKVSDLPDMLNGDDFITYNNEKASNRFGAGSIIAKESDIDGNGVNDRTDWMKELYRAAETKDISLSMSGGSDKASFYGSGRYVIQQGTSIGNQIKMGQARVNMDVTPKTWFKAGTELSFSKSMNNGILSDRYSAGSVVGWQAFPNVPVYNPTGPGGYNLTATTPIGILGWGNNLRTFNGLTLISAYNPVASQKLTRQDNSTEELRGNIYGEAQVIKGVKITTKFGVQYIDNFEDQYTSPFLAGLGQPYGGLVQNQDQKFKVWDWQNYITVDRIISGKHKVGLVAGSEYQKNDYQYYYLGAANFSDPFFQYIIDGAYSNVQPGTTTTLNLTGGNKSGSGLESYFARLNYSFGGKYFVEGSYRADAFSGFGSDNKWGYFPSVSVGWEATREKFVQDLNLHWLDFFKIRGSYGTVGNSRGITDYAARALSSGAVYTISTGLANSQAGNAGLRWETAKKTDIGFEANIFKSKVNIVFDYFKNNIDNLIFQAPTLYTVGIPGSSQSKNIGSMYNRGYELTVTATPVQGKNFTWTTSANFSSIKNKVTALIPENNNADYVQSFNVASIGRPLGTYLLPNWAGVDAATGNPMWYAANGSIKRYNFGATGANIWTDQNGTPVAALSATDNVYQEGKTGLPKWYGGWDNTVSYKQISLSITTMFQGGNYIYNQTRGVLLSNSFINNISEIKNRWTTPGQVTDIPRLFLADNQSTVASTRFLEKGDFLKVRTVTLSYTLAKSLLNKLGVDGVRAYVQLFNPLTITGYSGADPEVNTNRFNNVAVGTDLRNVPQTKTTTLGLQVSF